VMLYQGDLRDFFGCFGKKGTFLFFLLALALMGPFGVLARCLTVIHGAFVLLFPTASLLATSLLMCLMIYLLTANKNRIVPLLGSVLTPLLLMAIGFIVFFAFTQRSLPASIASSGLSAFTNGFLKGYQTMDLVASFFFSGFVIQHLYHPTSPLSDQASSLKLFFKASIIAAGLLYLVYFALTLLGWLYAPVLLHVPPEEMFGTIALESLGSIGAPCVCLAVIFACLTTAIALTSLFAEFLRTEVAKEKIDNHSALMITLSIAFLVFNLEFSGIAHFLGPILEIMYPALMS